MLLSLPTPTFSLIPFLQPSPTFPIISSPKPPILSNFVSPTNTSFRTSFPLHLLRLHRKQFIHMELRFLDFLLQLLRAPIQKVAIAVLQPQRSQIVRESELIHRNPALAISLILWIDVEPICYLVRPFSPSTSQHPSLHRYASRLSIDSSNERVLLTDNGNFFGLESTGLKISLIPTSIYDVADSNRVALANFAGDVFCHYDTRTVLFNGGCAWEAREKAVAARKYAADAVAFLVPSSNDFSRTN